MQSFWNKIAYKQKIWYNLHVLNLSQEVTRMGAILIVEDEIVIRKGLAHIVKTIDDKLEVFETGSAVEALKIANSVKIDIFFFDIQLLDYSGFDLAQQVREIDIYQLTPIVFITGVHSKELDAYRKIHCYSFIYKPFIPSDIERVFKEIQEGLQNQAPKTLKLKEKDFTYIINQDEIIYLESKNRKLLIKTIYEEAFFATLTLSKVAGQLSKHFMQCHKSYIINTSFISKIDRNHGYLNLHHVNHDIPIGRKYRDDVWRITL